MLTLRAIGPTAVFDDTGVDRTPRGKKSRAILALLAFAPNRRRPRAWIQDKLWSDRAAPQGADSLRKALCDVRRSLGPHRGAIRAERGVLELAPDAWRIDMETGRAHLLDGVSDLFEDLDIRDREFEHWIRDCRQSQCRESVTPPNRGTTPHTPLPIVLIEAAAAFGDQDSWIFRMLKAQIAKTLLEHGNLRILDDSGDDDPTDTPPEGGGVCITLDIKSFDDRTMLAARISRVCNKAVAWQTHGIYRREEFVGPAAAPLKLVNEIADKTISTLRDKAEEISGSQLDIALFAKARSAIFRFDKESLQLADTLLAGLEGGKVRPQALAWRYFVRNIAMFEHRTDNFLKAKMDRVALAEEALRCAPDNSVVLAFASQAELVHAGNTNSAVHLARQAVERNPVNAFGWALLSNAQLVQRQYAEGDRSARMAERIVEGSDIGFFWNIYSCMAAVAVGEHERAIEVAERAVLMAPRFCAPRRYLVALYKHTGRDEAFHNACAEMRRLEPDFEVTQLFDPQYPVSTLRQLPIVQTIS